jgi:hypothetical protein
VDETHQRRRHEHENQEETGMHHAGDRALCTGPLLVAVRAIVPVTLIPPNRAEAIFAMPSATSSML